jgi:hypothetical protein
MRGNRKLSSMVTLEEAMGISERRLPEEPGEDWLESWQAARPQPEPPKQPRKLDTAPPVDWAAEIQKAVDRERRILTEATGTALAEIRDDALDEVEKLIAAAVEQLRAEFSGQLAQLRCQTDTLGGELKAQLEKIIARKRRAKAAKTNGSNHGLPSGEPLLLPGLNGDARPQ